jgi:hypothetical protein
VRAFVRACLVILHMFYAYLFEVNIRMLEK